MKQPRLLHAQYVFVDPATTAAVFKRYNIVKAAALYEVWGSGPSDVFAVNGFQGQILDPR